MLQKTTTRPYIIIVDGVWRQADVLDVPPQLRQHLHKNILSHLYIQACMYICTHVHNAYTDTKSNTISQKLYIYKMVHNMSSARHNSSNGS